MRTASMTTLLALLVASFAHAAFDPATGAISDERWRSGVPLGGIGTGGVELLTDGALGNATINNNWDRPTGLLRGAFVAVWARRGEQSAARILRLPASAEYSNVANILHTRYVGLYPRAMLSFDDPTLPVLTSLHAWSAMIPRNVKDSSLPAAVLEVTLRNPTTESVQASALVSWENLLGYGGRRDVNWEGVAGNQQSTAQTGDLQGLRFTTTQKYSDMQQNTVGDYFLGVEQSAGTVSLCPTWDSGAAQVPFWEGFAHSGTLNAVVPGALKGRPAGAVACRVDLAPGQERVVRFFLTWNLPTVRMEHTRTGATGNFVDRADAGRAALDGNPTTRWTTGHTMKVGEQITLDLGSEQTVNELTLDSAGSPNDFPHGYLLEASCDGAAWTQLAAATGEEAEAVQQAGVLTIRFAPTPARFLRVTNQGNHDQWFWSLHELSAAGPTGKLDLSAAKLSDRLAEIATSKQTDDVGHYHNQFFTDAAGVARYVQVNRERLLAETRRWQEAVQASNLPNWLKLKLINCTFSMTSCTILTRDGRFAVLESPIDMRGALGTMDQRMAAHAFYQQMFPELDKSELELFRQCQQTDGRITHFIGNIHEAIGVASVGYGVTDWPDLQCSWILQCLKEYRWTGDRAFLQAMWPGIQRSVQWLRTADRDGDLIPEGGSTYDYETVPRGAFVYNASCTLAALLGAEEAARVLGHADLAQEYRDRFHQVQEATIRRLWNGEFFRKWRSGRTDDVIPNSFVAALAGDWLARLTGLRDTLPRSIADGETEQLIARHLRAFFPVPPMEVTPEGRCATGACFLLQHEPYLGCEAIYRGYVDDGLETIRRVWYCAWEKNHNPWQQSLSYGAPGGGQGGLRSYMTCPTTWHVLNALTGVSLNLPEQTLYISPRLWTGATELHVPVFLADFWGRVDYVPAQRQLSLTITRVFSSGHELSRVAADGNGVRFALDRTFKVTEGARLDLSPFLSRLGAIPVSRQSIVRVPKVEPPNYGLPPTLWKAQAIQIPQRSAEGDDPRAAFDRDPGTRWATGRGVKPGDWFQLDLGETRRINRIWADIDNSENDYPRGYEVQVSGDGETWQTVAREDEATSRRAVRHSLWRTEFASVVARYVKITQLGTDSYWWWSIYELYVLPPEYQAPINWGLLNVEKTRAR